MSDTLKLDAVKIGIAAALAAVALSLIALVLASLFAGTMMGGGFGMFGPGAGMMGSGYAPPSPGAVGIAGHMTFGGILVAGALRSIGVGIAVWLTALIYNKIS